jgi:hypothetical protein
LNKITSLILGGLLALAGFFTYLHQEKLFGLFPQLPTSTQLPHGAIVIWNKTDKEIEVTARPYHGRYHKIDLPPAARGYVVLAAQDEDQTMRPLPLKYLLIRCGGRRYKFSENDTLNSCPGSGTNSLPNTRYFAVMKIDKEYGRWGKIKKKLAADGIELNDRKRYFMLSNHCKLGSPEDPRARVSVLKTGRS